MLSITLDPPRAAKQFVQNGVIRSIYCAVNGCNAPNTAAPACLPPAAVSPTVLVCPEVLPGMKSPTTSWSSADRSTVVVDLLSLVTGDATQVQSLHSFRNAFPATSQHPPTEPSMLDALPHVLGCEIQIAIMALTPVQLAFGGDRVVLGHSATAAKLDGPTTVSHYEVQLGYAHINVVDLVLGLVLDPRRSMQVALSGNGSTALQFLRAPRSLTLTGNLVTPFGAESSTAAWASAWRRLAERHSRHLLRVVTPAWKQWYTLVNSVMEQYKRAFVDYAAAEIYKSSAVSKLRAAAQSDKTRLYPHYANLTRYHVQAWDYYAFVNDCAGKESAQASALRLPIGYYNRPAPAAPVDSARYRLQLQFVKAAFDVALTAHGVNSDVSLQRLTQLLQLSPAALSATERALLFAYLLEVVPFALTFPALAGKYRSDIAPNRESLTGGRESLAVDPSESCDCNRLVGQSCSDDCEGCEACTREVYFMLRQFGGGGGAGTSSHAPVDNLEQLVWATSRFLYTHYDYVSVSGATTAAFPGLDLQRELLHFDPQTSRTSDASSSTQLLRKMMYGSKEDDSARSGFHQYSMLVPVSTLHAMVQASTPPRAVAEYYEQRLAASSSQFTVPGILLESTAPVSGAFVGLSYLLAPSEGLAAAAATTAAALPTNPLLATLLRLDESAALDAVALKTAARKALAAAPTLCDDVRHKDTHALRATWHDRGLPGRYTNTFYRHACHGINVSMLAEEAGFVEKHGFNMTAAMSYMTFINGSSGGFGVPVERLVTGPVQESVGSSTPDSVALPFLAHPDKQLREKVYAALDELDKTLRITWRLPRSIFGTMHLAAQPPIASASALGQPVPPPPPPPRPALSDLDLATAILSSRVFLFKNLDTGSMRDENAAAWHTFNKEMQDVVMKHAVDGSSVAVTTQSINMFPLAFGQPVVIVSCRPY